MTESREGVSPQRRRFDEAFKRDAVRLVVEEGYTLTAAAAAVGVTDQTIREWRKKFGPPIEPCGEDASASELKAEVSRLRRELKRAQMERDILPLDRSTPRAHVSQNFSRFLDLTVRGVRCSWLICFTWSITPSD